MKFCYISVLYNENALYTSFDSREFSKKLSLDNFCSNFFKNGIAEKKIAGHRYNTQGIVMHDGTKVNVLFINSKKSGIPLFSKRLIFRSYA